MFFSDQIFPKLNIIINLTIENNSTVIKSHGLLAGRWINYYKPFMKKTNVSVYEYPIFIRPPMMNSCSHFSKEFAIYFLFIFIYYSDKATHDFFSILIRVIE